MVIGLFGIASDGGSGLLKPDYRVTNTQLAVYRNLIEHSILTEPSLDLFSLH
jgi:hypothetical protein